MASRSSDASTIQVLVHHAPHLNDEAPERQRSVEAEEARERLDVLQAVDGLAVVADQQRYAAQRRALPLESPRRHGDRVLRACPEDREALVARQRLEHRRIRDVAPVTPERAVDGLAEVGA